MNQVDAAPALVRAREVVEIVVIQREDAVRVAARNQQPPGQDAGRARVEVFALVSQAHRAADVGGVVRGRLARRGRAVRALHHIDSAREDRLNLAAPEVEFADTVRATGTRARGADGQHPLPGTGGAVRIGGRNRTRVQAHAREGLVEPAHREDRRDRAHARAATQLTHDQPAARVDRVMLANRQRACLHPGDARVGVDGVPGGIQREQAPAQLGQAARARVAGRADAPADGDFRGRAGLCVRRFAPGRPARGVERQGMAAVRDITRNPQMRPAGGLRV